MRNLILFFSLFFVVSSYGQITIYPDDVFHVGSWAEIASVPDMPPGFDPGTAGPDQTWDFSGFIMDTTYRVLFLDPSETPFGDEFPESNIVLNRVSYLDSAFIYGIKSDTTYKNVGLGGQFEEYNNVIAPFEPYQTALRFPVNYQDSIHEISLMEFKVGFDDPGVDSAWVRIWFDSHIVVDAWGELSTPVGTYDVLRSKATYFRTDTTWLLESGIWELYDVYEGTRVEYDFMTNTEGYPVVEFASNAAGTYFGWFSYLVHYGPLPFIREYDSEISLQIYPVPASDIITARWDKMLDGTLMIFDISGRMVIQQKFLQSKEVKIDVSGLKEGSYLYNINFADGEIVSSGKIIIQ